MGCAVNKSACKIQRSTAIEIINEEEYKQNPENVKTATCRSNGEVIKVHYRTLYSEHKSKVSKLNN
jgi:hypothetical protein